MKARYANVHNFNRVVKTYKWLVDLFGSKEFSSEDFNKASASIGGTPTIPLRFCGTRVSSK